MAKDIVQKLYATIVERSRSNPDKSWSARLLHDGNEAICAKVAEEAQEVIKATVEGPDRLAQESADLLYHLLVLLVFHRVPIEAVYRVLESRQGRSGLAEKAARLKNNDVV